MMNIDPMQWAQELAVVLLVALLLAVGYRYRRRIMFVVTGDDRIHADILDCLNFLFCTCCGLSSGDWTRWLSSCWCCSHKWKGTNLAKTFRRLLGMSSQTIEVKNIVCGDLPYDSVRGDFFVCISVSSNPDMVTALQEEKKPKVVHFPEILQVKVRNSPLEPRVVITVKELNIAGSQTLCELKLTATSIIDWADDEEPLKRFQMKSVNTDIERETHPWIAMEFSQPTETRLIDQMANVFRHLKVVLYLQTGTQPDGRNSGAQARSKTDEVMYSDGTILGTRAKTAQHIRDFKHQYTLLDDSGNPIEEPREEDLHYIRRIRYVMQILFGLWDFLCIFAVLLYGVARIYVWSCYRQFGWLTQAQLNGWPLISTPQYPDGHPISNFQLADIRKKCTAAIVGTGAIEGENPCRPNFNQTLYVCENLPEANRPEAFVGLAHDWFGWNVRGVTCAHGVCVLRNRIAEYDHLCVITVIFMVISTRLCRCFANDIVKSAKRKFQKRNADQMHASKKSEALGGGLLPTHNLGRAAMR